ncbi:hypothetical protein Chor_009646 [Crotalus horridus]
MRPISQLIWKLSPPLPEKGAPGERSSEFTGVWNKIRPIKSSVITQVFHVPLEERRYKDNSQFGEGDEAKVCVDIMQKTGAHIELSLAKDQGLSIMVTGKLDSVMKARKEIVARLQTQNGEKLQELELKTATKINIPRPEDLSSQIKIMGTKEGIEKARHEILLISAEQDKRAVECLNLEKVFHPFIAGAFNKTVQEIMQETGARINIPPPSVSKDEIIITGEKEPVSQALLRIRKIYEDKAKSVMVAEVHIEFTDGDEKIALEGPTEEVELAQSQIQEIIRDLLRRMDYTEVLIDQRFHRHLIGKNGANINRIKEQHKVSVRIPPDSEKSNLIRIEGDPQGENERTKDLIIEQRFHRTIIGQKGEKIKEVRDKFPEVIINFPDPSQKSDIVQLRGPKNEVEKCGKYLQKVIAELIENSFSIPVPIFKQFHKNIIGKGGANIKKIREETNTKIDLPTENSNSEVILITGKKANCEDARDRILAIQRELANIKEVDISIPAKLHNSLIGAKGRLVRSIMEECGGVHIHFPSEGSGSEKVTIRGPGEEVERAKRQLLHLAEEKDNVIEDSMVVDPKYHRHFVARRGHVLREIAEEYGGVTVSFPRTGVQSDRVTLKGAKDCVEAAKKRILEIISDLRYHRVVMGAKGYKVQQITRDHDVLVKFPERDDNSGEWDGESQENGDVTPELDTSPRKCDIILISGRKEKCEAARSALLVTISVPQPEQQSDIIKVTGLVPNVERAKAGLLDRVRELQAEQEDRALRGFKLTASVEPKYHPKIIGKKGAVISQIRKDHDVTVQFPDKGDEHQDLITITGYKKNAEAARDAILKIVADLEEMVSEDVRLDHRVHARIIGGRGKAIRKLMEEFRVDIRFPQPGSSDPDRVTVTGLPENMMDVVETETMAAYMKPPSRLEEEPRGPAKGFVVRDAPWNASGNKAPDVSSAEEFPIFGTGVVPKQASVWGPKKF